MFIQIKDLDLEQKANANVFIIHTYGTDETLYISRSYVEHKVSQYTSTEKENAIVYFNRQAAESALTTEFKFTTQPWTIEMVPVNNDVKDDAKKKDAVKRRMKNERRRERMLERERENQE